MNGVSTMPSGQIGLQAKDFKVGETIKIVIHGYGGISPFFEEVTLNPADRVVEVEIKSVKKVKKQELEDA